MPTNRLGGFRAGECRGSTGGEGLFCTGWINSGKNALLGGIGKSSRAVFDGIQILLNLMPLVQLLSMKFGITLIDPF